MKRPQHLVGHRGALRHFSTFGPDVLDYVVREGVRGIEVDARLSADGRVVCSYSDQFNIGDDASGSIESASVSELLEFGIITLETVLDRLANTAEILVEMKAGASGSTDLAVALAGLLESRLASGRRDQVRSVSSFDEREISRFGASTTHFASTAALLVRSDTPARDSLELAERLGLTQVHLHTSVLLPDLSVVERGLARGIAITAWVCNDLDDSLRLLRAGSDRIITDDPVALADGWYRRLGANGPS